MFKHWPALLFSIALSACGGGGGGSPGGGSPGPGPAPEPTPVPVSPVAVFTPSLLSTSITAGTSKALTVVATVVRPEVFAGATNVYALIVDDVGVILPATQVTAINASQYSATLYTAPTLAAGTHKGNFTLKLCRDAACAGQFAGSPVLLPYEFTITTPALPQITASSNLPLSASVRLGAAAATEAVVTVKADGRTWTATSGATWLKLSNASGAGNGSFNVRYDATGTPVGLYNTAVTVKSNDGQSAVLTASLNVMPTAFQIQGSTLLFNAVNGAPIPPQTLKFTLDNAVPSQWSAASDSPWLTADPLSGLTPATTTISVNPSTGAMASGRYNGILTLSSPVSKAVPFNVSLILTAPTLSLSANSITLGGTYGREFSNRDITMNLNTQGNRWPWTLTSPPAWARPSALSGTVDQSGGAISFTPDAAAAPLGTSTAVLSVGTTVNGDLIKLPLSVTINKDQRKLLAAETGVAMSSTPAWSRLSRTIKISDNFGLDAAWSARSDQSWLTVTASGRTTGGAGTLSLSANPAALPDNQVSYATVTLTSSDAGVQVPETIKVALWKGSVTPQSNVVLSTAHTNLLADPIRPFVYLHSGGASLDVYNVYTGAKTATIVGLGAALGDMAISPNGDTLYAFDTANRNIVLVDLASQARMATTWTLGASVTSASRLLAIRPNGVNVVVTNSGSAYLAATGKELSKNVPGGEIAASGDSRRLFAQAVGSAPNSIGAFSVDYSEMSGGMLMIAPYASGYVSGFAASIAANLDGSRAYLANGSPYRCIGYSGSDMKEIGMLPGGDAYPNNVRVASDGRVFCGIMGWYSTADVWVHRPDGSLQTSFKFAGYAKALRPRQMAVSGDALMLVALTDDPRLVFIPVGP